MTRVKEINELVKKELEVINNAQLSILDLLEEKAKILYPIGLTVQDWQNEDVKVLKHLRDARFLNVEVLGVKRKKNGEFGKRLINITRVRNL